MSCLGAVTYSEGLLVKQQQQAGPDTIQAIICVTKFPPDARLRPQGFNSLCDLNLS